MEKSWTKEELKILFKILTRPTSLTYAIVNWRGRNEKPALFED